MDIADFRRMFAYDSWANREVIASLSASSATPPKSLKWMAHIFGASDVWYTRIRGQKPELGVWPELSLAGCTAQEQRLRELWSRYLEEMEGEQLSTTISYKNSKGESWTSRIDDVLMHVVMHSAYHRGQIASDMRAAGHTPAYTDFIQGIRSGAVEESL